MAVPLRVKLATLALVISLAACGGLSTAPSSAPPCDAPTRYYTGAVGNSDDGTPACFEATAAAGTWLRVEGDPTFYSRVELQAGDLFAAFTCGEARDEPSLEPCD